MVSLCSFGVFFFDVFFFGGLFWFGVCLRLVDLRVTFFGGIELGVGPFFDDEAFFFGEERFGVCDDVERHGHFSLFDFFPDLFDLLSTSSLRVFPPLGEVQLSSALIDVMCDSPRDGRDIAVPGPLCLVRVAIITGFLDDFFHLRGEFDL